MLLDSPLPMANAETTLEALFDAQRAARDARDRLAELEPGRLLPVLERATRESLALQDEDERAVRLDALAHVLGEMEGPRVVDLLVDILGSGDFDARSSAGEALAALAWDRFKEVAQGAERAIDRLAADNPALVELPYLIAEIPEPGVTKVLAKFLAHAHADVVAAAIEAVAEAGDPAAALPLLDKLAGDKRRVQIEDEGGTEGQASIAELVSEARALVGKRAR